VARGAAWVCDKKPRRRHKTSAWASGGPSGGRRLAEEE
jgi:hypothetical protein